MSSNNRFIPLHPFCFLTLRFGFYYKDTMKNPIPYLGKGRVK